MGHDLPPPYLRPRTTSQGIRYALMEPMNGDDGRVIHVVYDLGAYREPRDALERCWARLAERLASYSVSADPDELALLEVARARVESLAEAVAKYEAGRE